MASIKLTGDTSGEITISAPAVAGTNTLTLPAETGTVLTTNNFDLNGQELILDADGDSSITADTDDVIDFKTGGTDRMSIDASGRVTIASIPSFLAYFSGVPATDGTITSGSDYVFEVTKYNVGSHYNTSNGRFTAPVAGLYEFNFSAYYTNSNSSTARMQTAWKVNGTEYSGADALGHILRDPNQCGGVITGEQTIVLDLSANDYVTVFARGGINRVYRGHCHFSGRLIG